MHRDSGTAPARFEDFGFSFDAAYRPRASLSLAQIARFGLRLKSASCQIARAAGTTLPAAPVLRVATASRLRGNAIRYTRHCKMTSLRRSRGKIAIAAAAAPPLRTVRSSSREPKAAALRAFAVIEARCGASMLHCVVANGRTFVSVRREAAWTR